jgi:hypothetical protein
MKAKMLIVFLALISLFPLVEAQTTLKPGQTTFSVQSILVSAIQLQGNPSYLNIYWNATYIGGAGNIKTICYLNCNPKAADCSSAQNCSYTGPTGSAVCTIINPLYKYYEDNLAVCKFFNPAFPTTPYEPYPNKTFRPVAFNVWLSSATVVIGTPLDLQANVKNIGLFDDSYNVTVSTPTPNILWIDPQTAQTFVGPLKGDSYLSIPETGFSSAGLTVLTDDPCVCVTANSTARADVLGNYNMNVDCSDPAKPYLKCIKIKSKLASLPDFGLLGIIQIILLAAAVALLKF